MTDEAQYEFYENLVRRLRRRGVVCGITSGLACVHFGLAQSTKDCDLLCHMGAFDLLLAELEEIQIDGNRCRYRGHISPPLAADWHAGGWTSHFQWGAGPDAVTLDVFGRALRGSAPWEDEIAGLYVSPHVVAEMKRTNRPKDWPYITLLGERLLQDGDPRGWLHIYDPEALRRLARHHEIPAELAARRPSLRLAINGDAALDQAVDAERRLWEELDRSRIEIYRRALRPYNLAMIRAGELSGATLREEHEVRLNRAHSHLRKSPLLDFGIEAHVAEAHTRTAKFVHPDLLAWLPDVTEHFQYLQP